MKAHFRLTLPKDIPELASCLRQADREEIKAHSGESPVESLWRGYNLSAPCYSIVGAEGEVVGMFGVVPGVMPEMGHPWMLCTDGLKKYQFTFIKQARQLVESMNIQHQILTNVIDKRNTLHMKWLRSMGFVIVKEYPKYGVGRRPFMRFERRKNV